MPNQRRREGGTTEAPSPEIVKLAVKNRCYLPVVYTFREEEETQEIFGKICEKVNFI